MTRDGLVLIRIMFQPKRPNKTTRKKKLKNRKLYETEQIITVVATDAFGHMCC
jgi:hypothetical protein